MCIVLLSIYVFPYQEATDALTAAGGIDWMNGEALMVPAGPIVAVPTAIIAWRMIKADYG